MIRLKASRGSSIILKFNYISNFFPWKLINPLTLSHSAVVYSAVHLQDGSVVAAVAYHNCRALDASSATAEHDGAFDAGSFLGDQIALV